MANEAMMKQYRDLKQKHPDAMLLFRCGDFYETYEDDAKECAKVLGITLTKRQSDGVAMAGFPHHALDTYLPKLVRTGHRVAICDQLDPPPGSKRKRGESETSNSSDNNQNSEDKVMTNETMKVADLIGKAIVNGNAKYVIKSVEGDKVKVDFAMGDNAAKEMNMKAEQIEKLLQGGWQVSDGTQEPTEKKADGGSQKAEDPKAKTVKMEQPKQEKPKAEQPKVTLKRKQSQAKAKAEEPKPQAEQPQGGRYQFSTYTRPTSDGGTKTLGRIDGLQEGDELLERGVAEKIHASPMYDRDGERKVWWLSFGKRYVEAGRKVCEALNEGRSLDDCVAIVDAQTDENHARSEARRKRNQEREGRNHQPSDVSPQPSSGKTYTEAEVADLMRRVIAGDQEAMAIVNAMAA